MLTPQDVRSVQFEKNLRGYRTEEVDRFLDKVEEQLTQSENEAEALRKQIADLTAENQKLRQEMKDYEADGDMLKSALINAQRMGENVIREANQKAEEILHRANLRGDDVIRDANELLQKASDRADEIINEANEKKLAEERERMEQTCHLPMFLFICKMIHNLRRIGFMGQKALDSGHCRGKEVLGGFRKRLVSGEESE